MKITAEELADKFGDNVYRADQYVREQMPEYPDRPKKPTLSEHKSEAVAEYGKQLKVYEKELKAYEKAKAAWDEADNKYSEVMKAYIKDVSGFDKVPEKAKEKVWRKAYEDGHSDGYSQIYYELCELVELFD